MDKGLFRQKSIDRISSPEQLHDYMRVTSPRLWMILTAVILLLAGFIVYAFTANMENTMTIRVRLEKYQSETPEEEGQVYTFVSTLLPEEMLDTVKAGMKLRLGKEEGRIGWIYSGMEDNQISVIFDMDHTYIPMDDGDYDAVLVLESTTPISFLWN